MLEQLLELLPFVLVPLTREEVHCVAEHVEPKDAHVIAAAYKAHVSYLVTLDKRHLLTNDAARQLWQLDIVTPGQALEIIGSHMAQTDADDAPTNG